MMNCGKKVEELKEENKLLRKDIEWLNRESNMKDKLLSEKVSMLNNLIQIVNTTTTTTSQPLDPYLMRTYIKKQIFATSSI